MCKFHPILEFFRFEKRKRKLLVKTKCHIFIKLLINIFTLCFLTLQSPLKGMKRVTFCHLSKEHSTSKMEDILVNEPIN